MIKKQWGRVFTSFLLVLTVLTATSSVALAFSDKDSSMGEIIVSGNSDGNGSYVLLDGQKAYNGRTFISSGTITTAEKGATIKMKNLGLINLAPNTTLSLNISKNDISGDLSKGKIKVLNNKGVNVDIATADSKISNNGTQKNIFDVDLSSGTTQANSEVGSVILNTEGTETVVTAKQDDDDDDDNGSIVPLVLVFTGVVALAAILVVTNNDDDNELNTISATF